MAAEVVSSNIVGYNKLTIQNTTGYLMIAPQFVPVGAAAADYPVDIQDVFVSSTFPDPVLDASGEDIEWGAKLMLWNGVGYDTYCWTGKTGEDFFENPAWDDKWTGNFGEYLAKDVTIAPGQGVFLWVKDGSAGTTATVAGEVINEESMSVSLAAGSTGYNMIANPFPESISIQDIAFSGLADPVLDASGEDIEWGAKLMLWNGVGYDTYCWTGKTGEDFFENPAWDDKWTKNFGESLADDVSVGVGEGFFLWMNPNLDATTATATFSK